MCAKAKILLVDDDVDFVESTKDLLEAHNYEVDFAYDGKTGVKKAKENKPGLMVLDVMMTTKTEGFEVAREIAGDDELKSMPVIMMTGIRKDMNLNYGFEPDEDWLPVTEFLEKPVEPAKFIATVEKLLHQAGGE